MQTIPKTITAGVSFSATIDLPAYADGWDVTLHMRGPSAVDIEATPDWETRFAFARTSLATKDWAPGLYAWTIRATKGDDVAEVASGTTTIVPDLVAAGAGHDARSQWVIGLEAIDAVIGKRATLDQERYRINNRELWRTPVAELIRLRNFYQQKVSDERNGGPGRFRDLRVSIRPVGC